MQHRSYQFSRLAFLLILVLLAGCASSPKATQESAASTELPAPMVDATLPESSLIALTDSLGREVILPGPAQRIVSLAPSNTEILFAIGAGAQVVGRDSFSDYLPKLPRSKISVVDLASSIVKRSWLCSQIWY